MMLKKNDMDISSKISLYRNDDVLQYYDWNGVKGVLKFNLKHLANNPFNREWLSTLVDVHVDNLLVIFWTYGLGETKVWTRCLYLTNYGCKTCHGWYYNQRKVSDEIYIRKMKHKPVHQAKWC